MQTAIRVSSVFTKYKIIPAIRIISFLLFKCEILDTLERMERAKSQTTKIAPIEHPSMRA